MAQRRRRANADKLTFRIFPPYAELIEQAAEALRLSPNEFGRVATMAAADSGLLELNERLRRIESELKRLRQDFRSATE